MSRLPQPGSDKGTWGNVLNDYLSQSLNADGTLKAGIVTATNLDSASQAALTKAGTSVQIGGDLSGSTTAPTVSKIQGNQVAPGTPSNGQVLVYNTTTSTWTPGTVSSTTVTDATTGAKGIVQLAGDLAGTAASPTVPGLTAKAPLASPTFTGTVTVPTPTNPTDATTKAYVDTAAAAGAPDATSSVKGKIQLANDFGGTAAAPTVTSTHLSAALPVAQGGTGSATQNFVDLSTAQTVAGNKTFSGNVTINGTATVAGPVNGTDAATKSYVDSAISTGTGGAAIALTAASVKTSSFTAVANTIVPFDATSGALTATLPTAPADKSRVTIKKIDASANIVTISTGGSDVFNKAGGGTSLTLQVTNQAISLQYAATGAIWYVVSDDIPASWVVLGVSKTISSAYTLVNSDHVILADATSAAFNLTLPTAVGYYGRFTIAAITTGTNVVTVGTTSSQTISGASTVTVGTQASGAGYSAVDVVSDGANWRIV